MAVLATPDWLSKTRENTMDVPSNSRPRMSPGNEQGQIQGAVQSGAGQPAQQHQQQQQQQQQQLQHQQLLHQQQMLLAAQQQHQQQQQQPAHFPYPVQQQPQGSWTPNITAPPFYPSFFQNHHQQPSPQPYPTQQPYFDSANAQLAAQWAYQQMMFNAQHAFPQQQRPTPNQPGQPQSPNDYFAGTQISPVFNPFPSGTPPPPHPHRTASSDPQQQAGGSPGQYPGFHPYRRPNRQGSSQPHSPAPSDSVTDWRQGIGQIPHPPYARPDASGSTSSLNSSSSRQRTNSNQSVQSNGKSGSHRSSPVSAGSSRNSPSPAAPPVASSVSPSSAQPSPLRQPHHRNSSTSSSVSTSTATSGRPGTLSPSPATSSVSTTSATATTTVSTNGSGGSANPRPARPSPLSQGSTFTASEKRMSRDDIDLGNMQHDAAQIANSRSGGLKGRLRRALSFNTAQALKEEEMAEAEEEEDDDVSIKASQLNSGSVAGAKMKGKAVAPSTSAAGSKEKAATSSGADSGVEDSPTTPAAVPKKKSKAASLFNSRMNMSTDNISLSSTVSSASVMIRKLGAMGRLARRNSLAGIASIFKDKEKDKEGGEKDKKGKKKDKKGSKSEVSEASVSHVTAELDRMAGDWTVNTAEMQGLSPAAKLARQHTLKSNAEAAARAKEAAAAATAARESAAASSSNVNGNGTAVPTWDRNTATRQGSASPVKGLSSVRVNEDGTRTLVEEDEEESDDGHYHHQQGSSYGSQNGPEGWDDDEDWDVDGEEEDVTIRQELGGHRGSSGDEEVAGYGRPSTEMEPWAMDIRRSVERSRKPKKGILKYALTYDQNSYLQQDHATLMNRGRSNSYTSLPAGQPELGPLARIPSPDPDHIDGLHRHGSHSSSHGHPPQIDTTPPLLPPLAFESTSPLTPTFINPSTGKDLPATPTHSNPTTPTNATFNAHSENRNSAIYQNPSFNSSAPALSTIGSSKSPPTLVHRSQTAPAKRLTFATNLSVYDTFSPNVYDRRSEPATWSRLTPALAQRIKEELNSYKMEEMEVHSASRINTQFFV